MSAQAISNTPIVRLICRLFNHPCRVKMQPVFTPVTWPDDYKPGSMRPDLYDLERNEIPAPEDNYSCIKIEDFKQCWCGQYEKRVGLDYEA